jgi:hypothetical protein
VSGWQAGVDGADTEKPILGTAADALEAWLVQGKITEGAVFRRIRRATGSRSRCRLRP